MKNLFYSFIVCFACGVGYAENPQQEQIDSTTESSSSVSDNSSSKDEGYGTWSNGQPLTEAEYNHIGDVMLGGN